MSTSVFVNELKNLEVRLTRLEEVSAHQAVLIEELSKQLHGDAIMRQKFEAGLKILLERVRQVEDMTESTHEGEKPPHY